MGLPWSHHKNQGWESQLFRLHRWHKRVKEIGTANSNSEDMEKEHDYVYAFFQNCYHLKDWLKHSQVISPPQKVEDFINRHQEMQICADICNGTKHFHLTKPRHASDENLSVGREYVPSDWPGNRPHMNEKWFVISGETKLDIFDLADRCMVLWDKFLSNNNLI